MDIFVVDDETIIASSTAAILKLNGNSAIAFTDPYEALSAVQHGSPRLVIADLSMPELTGLALAARIRESCLDCAIILFTGLTFIPDSLEYAQEHGLEFSLLYIQTGRSCRVAAHGGMNGRGAYQDAVSKH